MTRGSTDQLLAFVDDELSDRVVDDIVDAVDQAAHSRSWSLGPPELIDDDRDGLRTVGCVLALHPTHDGSGNRVSADLDRASLEDTKALLALFAPLSARWHIDIGLELNGDSVGWLQNGEADASLREGLIAAWQTRH